MTTIVAIETSTAACSVALYRDGAVYSDHRLMPRQHNQQVLQMLDGLLASSGVSRSALDAVAFGRGPGSFTGVRIAAGIAQGIALARDLPVVAVSTLEILAAVGLSREPYAPGAVCALAARPGELYVGAFARGADAPLAVLVEALMSADAVHLPDTVAQGWRYCGDAAAAVAAQAGRTVPAALVHTALVPHAAELARIAVRALGRGDGFGGAGTALPVYLQRDLPWRKITRAPARARGPNDAGN